MRIAVSGAHGVGKTTLVEALAAAMPGYATVDEPYWQLVEEGHEVAAMPSIEDFERQLERAIECVADSEADVVLDRSPLDLIAYLETHEDADAFDLDAWLPAVREAVARLDLIVFVPIEERARPRGDDEELGRIVDERLRELVVGDELGLELEVVEVGGSVSQRVAQVLAHLAAR